MPTSQTSRQITQLGLVELAELISTGEVSSLEAVDAFAAEIAAQNPRLLAFTQLRLDDARREAGLADAAVLAGESLGPLHGVPISIKDCFAVAGLETTLGIPGFSQGADREDSPLVKRLKAAGAIVLGKTNVPQGMLMHECDNPLYGRTLHPLSAERSPGGSSGGEGVAVASRMSPFGLASDLGGSTRQPAHACGVVGFKPTSGRLTIHGSRRAIPGMKSLIISPGPITHSVADADLAMRALLKHQVSGLQEDERDEPWLDYRRVNVAGLRIAYWTDNGVVAPCAAIARAVETSAEDLRQRGADVRRVTPTDTEEMLRIYFGLISADGMQSLASLLNGAVESQLRRQVRLAKIPRWLRTVLRPVLAAAGQPALSKLVRWTGPRSAYEYWRLTEQAAQYRDQFWDSLSKQFGGEPVDVVLTPPHSLPALRHRTGLHLLLEASYCYLANLLDAPAGVTPRAPITAEEEQAEIAANSGSWAVEARLRSHNARGSTGLPIGVQVMARPWRDDVALAVMAALEDQADT